MRMKKMLMIIIVLAIIFVGMILYRNMAVNNKTQVNIQEIEKIEETIQKIYLWKEVTGEALPTFEDSNQAKEIWVWEVVKNNLENYEVSYEEIGEKAKEIFGKEFTKEFPKEGNESLNYESTTQKYIATEIELDQKEDTFLLDEIQKTKEGYEVEIIEYLEDYGEENNIVIRNTKEEEIGRVSTSDSETKIQEIVKDQKDRFIKKKILLIQENDQLIVKKVE